MSRRAAERGPTSKPGRRAVPITRDALFWGPVLGLAAALVATRWLGLDTALADVLYAAQGHRWALRHAWLTSDLLHKDAQNFSIAIGFATLGAIVVSCFAARLKPYRRGLIAVLVSALICLLLVSLSKHELPLACPWDMQRYGGELAGYAVFHFYWQQDIGGCFPAGHAAGGYCLVVWYFFARHYRLPHAWLALLPAAVLGPVFGITQQLRGAHFLSHDLTSALLCWAGGYVLFRAIMGDFRAVRAAASPQPSRCG